MTSRVVEVKVFDKRLDKSEVDLLIYLYSKEAVKKLKFPIAFFGRKNSDGEICSLKI